MANFLLMLSPALSLCLFADGGWNDRGSYGGGGGGYGGGGGGGGYGGGGNYGGRNIKICLWRLSVLSVYGVRIYVATFLSL